MKKLGVFLFLTFCLVDFPASSQQNTGDVPIAMLNYLATETQIINISKDNRLVLEEIQIMLNNETNPSMIDEKTQDYLNEMKDKIEEFRLIALQRERLQFFLENSQAQAITQAMPNPLYLLGNGRDLNPMKLIITATAMTADSALKFQSAKNAGQIEFLRENWQLDDAQSKVLADLSKKMFNYMIDVSRDYNLAKDGTDTLNEISINNFIKYKTNQNAQQKRQSLESNQRLYAKYGAYWLALTETYYDLEMWQDCLNAIQSYEAIRQPIFRKDFEYANMLPKAIIASSYIYKNNITYTIKVSRYLQKLVDNTTESDWLLRYFAAQTYISLAAIENKNTNLQSAYKLLVDNVTYLSYQQETLLSAYANPIETVSKGLTKTKEKQAKDMITKLKENRKTELPPLHSGLSLNYQTLFAVMQELKTPQQEKKRLSEIMSKAFLIPSFRHKYFDSSYEFTEKLIRLSRNSAGIGGVANSILSSAVSGFGDLTWHVNKGVGNTVNSSIMVNWNEIDFECPAVFLTAGATLDINIRSGTQGYSVSDIQYEVTDIIRKNITNVADYTAKIHIKLTDTVKIEKTQNYTLRITISIDDASCVIVFSSPTGKTDFTFLCVE